jgi:hypothetical protein
MLDFSTTSFQSQSFPCSYKNDLQNPNHFQSINQSPFPINDLKEFLFIEDLSTYWDIILTYPRSNISWNVIKMPQLELQLPSEYSFKLPRIRSSTTPSNIPDTSLPVSIFNLEDVTPKAALQYSISELSLDDNYLHSVNSPLITNQTGEVKQNILHHLVSSSRIDDVISLADPYTYSIFHQECAKKNKLFWKPHYVVEIQTPKVLTQYSICELPLDGNYLHPVNSPLIINQTGEIKQDILHHLASSSQMELVIKLAESHTYTTSFRNLARNPNFSVHFYCKSNFPDRSNSTINSLCPFFYYYFNSSPKMKFNFRNFNTRRCKFKILYSDSDWRFRNLLTAWNPRNVLIYNELAETGIFFVSFAFVLYHSLLQSPPDFFGKKLLMMFLCFPLLFFASREALVGPQSRTESPNPGGLKSQLSFCGAIECNLLRLHTAQA